MIQIIAGTLFTASDEGTSNVTAGSRQTASRAAREVME